MIPANQSQIKQLILIDPSETKVTEPSERYNYKMEGNNDTASKISNQGALTVLNFSAKN